MDLQKIRYFLAVMEHRNLSNAAQALRVSQPTLSRQMQALEHEFDTTLFVRLGRGVAPTEAAKRLHDGFQGFEIAGEAWCWTSTIATAIAALIATSNYVGLRKIGIGARGGIALSK